MKRAPPDCPSETEMVPPWASATDRQIARPIPVDPLSRAPANGSKMVSRSEGRTPLPSSDTATSTSRSTRTTLDSYPPSARRVARRVLEQVRQDLIDLCVVDGHQREIRAIDMRMSIPSSSRESRAIQASTSSPRSTASRSGQEGTRLDSTHVQEIRHQPIEPLGFVDDQRQELRYGLRRSIRSRSRARSRRREPSPMVNEGRGTRIAARQTDARSRRSSASARSCSAARRRRSAPTRVAIKIPVTPATMMNNASATRSSFTSTAGEPIGGRKTVANANAATSATADGRDPSAENPGHDHRYDQKQRRGGAVRFSPKGISPNVTTATPTMPTANGRQRLENGRPVAHQPRF